MPVLLLYGQGALAATRGPTTQLHRYTKIAVPERADPEDEPQLAAALAKLQDRAVVIWPQSGDEGRARAKRDAASLARSGAAAVGVVAAESIDLTVKRPPDSPRCRLRELADAALAAAKARTLPPLAGRAAQAVPPWLGEADMAETFAEACAFLRRYLAEPDATIETIALWCLHAWGARRARSSTDVSPRLVLWGLDPRAEHARALRLIAWLTPSPLTVSRTLAAHLLRVIEADKPTLLLDDVAGGILYRRDMRSLIAAGAYRDGVFLTACTKKNEAGRGHCFAPTAVATTTPLPEDVRLRSIVVPMTPVPMGETRARLTLLDPPQDLLELRAKMQVAATAANGDPFAFALLPRSLSTATRENWAPLTALALKIGPDAVKRVANIALALSASAPPAASNLALLRDIRDLGVMNAEKRIASCDLLSMLTADAERAWATVHYGRALTPRGLAERLSSFGVRPSLIRKDDGTVIRGYRGAAFIDAFNRYLGDVAPDSDSLQASDALQATAM